MRSLVNHAYSGPGVVRGGGRAQVRGRKKREKPVHSILRVADKNPSFRRHRRESLARDY